MRSYKIIVTLQRKCAVSPRFRYKDKAENAVKLG